MSASDFCANNECTNAETVKQCYKRLALIKHPDRRRDKGRAATPAEVAAFTALDTPYKKLVNAGQETRECPANDIGNAAGATTATGMGTETYTDPETETYAETDTYAEPYTGLGETMKNLNMKKIFSMSANKFNTYNLSTQIMVVLVIVFVFQLRSLGAPNSANPIGDATDFHGGMKSSDLTTTGAAGAVTDIPLTVADLEIERLRVLADEINGYRMRIAEYRNQIALASGNLFRAKTQFERQNITDIINKIRASLDLENNQLVELQSIQLQATKEANDVATEAKLMVDLAEKKSKLDEYKNKKGQAAAAAAAAAATQKQKMSSIKWIIGIILCVLFFFTAWTAVNSATTSVDGGRNLYAVTGTTEKDIGMTEDYLKNYVLIKTDNPYFNLPKDRIEAAIVIGNSLDNLAKVESDLSGQIGNLKTEMDGLIVEVNAIMLAIDNPNPNVTKLGTPYDEYKSVESKHDALIKRSVANCHSIKRVGFNDPECVKEREKALTSIPESKELLIKAEESLKALAKSALGEELKQMKDRQEMQNVALERLQNEIQKGKGEQTELEKTILPDILNLGFFAYGPAEGVKKLTGLNKLHGSTLTNPPRFSTYTRELFNKYLPRNLAFSTTKGTISSEAIGMAIELGNIIEGTFQVSQKSGFPLTTAPFDPKINTGIDTIVKNTAFNTTSVLANEKNSWEWSVMEEAGYNVPGGWTKKEVDHYKYAPLNIQQTLTVDQLDDYFNRKITQGFIKGANRNMPAEEVKQKIFESVTKSITSITQRLIYDVLDTEVNIINTKNLNGLRNMQIWLDYLKNPTETKGKFLLEGNLNQPYFIDRYKEISKFEIARRAKTESEHDFQSYAIFLPKKLITGVGEGLGWTLESLLTEVISKPLGRGINVLLKETVGDSNGIMLFLSLGIGGYFLYGLGSVLSIGNRNRERITYYPNDPAIGNGSVPPQIKDAAVETKLREIKDTEEKLDKLQAQREKADAEKQRKKEVAEAVRKALEAQPRISYRQENYDAQDSPGQRQITNAPNLGASYPQEERQRSSIVMQAAKGVGNWTGIRVPRGLLSSGEQSEQQLVVKKGEGKGGNRATKKRGKRHSKRNAKGAPRKTKYARNKATHKKRRGRK